MASNIIRIFGLAGFGMALLAVLVPSLVYRGKQGERYSLLNHFISELGEVGVSRAAWVFNACLLLSGLISMPYIIGLGMTFRSVLGWLGTAAGIVAVLGVAAVGVFPMNNLNSHVIAAVTYFRAGLVMVFFFGLAILFQPAGRTVIPPGANLLSLLAVLAYASFLLLPAMSKEQLRSYEFLDPQQLPQRPRFWTLAVQEWLVFFSTLAWLLGMTFFV